MVGARLAALAGPPAHADAEEGDEVLQGHDVGAAVASPDARAPTRGDGSGIRAPEPAADPEAPAPDVRTAPRVVVGPRAITSGLVAFGRAHLAVVGVVGLIGLLWAGWALFGARTVPVPTAVPSPVLSEAPAPTPTPTPMVRVHVLGAVASPGVVTLPVGARVEDALTAAGGLTEAARPGELNLAAVVADGAQIVVGDGSDPGGEVRGAPAAGAAGAPGEASGTLDLNTATAEQLETLPGVGPVTAAAILAWRQEHQRFSRVEELREVDGIGEKTYARIVPHVRI